MSRPTQLTADRLKELLHYDPATGVFTRRVARGREAAGSNFGHLKDGYFRGRIDGFEYRLNRLAWLYVTGTWPNGEVDHFNTVKVDNKFSNLRDLGKSANAQNQRRAHSHNKSGLLGVSIKRTKFRARIVVNGEQKHLGTFNTADEAYAAYVSAKRRLHEGCTL